MVANPYQVTKDLEAAVCQYTGARYAVCVGSCSVALQLAVMWGGWKTCPHPIIQANSYAGYSFEEAFPAIEIPKRTYVSVPAAIRLSCYPVSWRDEYWIGAYRLVPLPVWDCARRFTSGMYVPGQYQCVSFSTTKILGIEQGGAILHDCDEADGWFRRMRFDGRTEGAPVEDIREVGLHAIMLPSIAAQLVLKLHHLPRHNDDLPWYDYPDLSLMLAFR